MIDVILYALLIYTISKLKAKIHGAAENIKRKSLLYVTVLFIGCILEGFIISHRQKVSRKILAQNCPELPNTFSVIILHMYLLKFVYDPTSYFFFNELPRQMLMDRLTFILQKISFRRTSSKEPSFQSKEPAAVVSGHNPMFQSNFSRIS